MRHMRYSGELLTTIDDPNWAAPREVLVLYSISGDEITSLQAASTATEKLIDLTSRQERDLIEEIWDDVRENEDYC